MKKVLSTVLSLTLSLVLSAQAFAGDGVSRWLPKHKRLVQMAILLDTSNSMDGLIEQAKSQLWKIA